MKALILDDEQRYRDHIERSLERQGLGVYVAANADEAKKIVLEFGIDLMIVDIKLANSIDGLEFAAWAKRHDCDVGLIIITGHSSPDYERRSLDLGTTAYIEKPFGLGQLNLYVQRALDQRNLLRELHSLEQQLAEAKSRAAAGDAANVWPVVYLSQTGEVLFATSEGAAALESVCDPILERPLRQIDTELLVRLKATLPPAKRKGQTLVYRRDGVASHYVGLVRLTDWCEQRVLAVFFIDPERELPLALNDIWGGILGKILGNE